MQYVEIAIFICIFLIVSVIVIYFQRTMREMEKKECIRIIDTTIKQAKRDSIGAASDMLLIKRLEKIKRILEEHDIS
jgi:cell division protein FtsL